MGEMGGGHGKRGASRRVYSYVRVRIGPKLGGLAMEWTVGWADKRGGWLAGEGLHK